MKDFKLNKIKLMLLIVLIISSVISGLLFWKYTQTKKQDIFINALFVPLQSVKGENIPITIELIKNSTKQTIITQIFIEIESITYGYNTLVRQTVHISLLEIEILNITVILKPLLNGTEGYYALNVGLYKIKSVAISVNDNETLIKRSLDTSFEIVNQAEQNAISNGDFERGLFDWQITQSDNNTEVGIENNVSINQSLCIQSVNDLNNATTTWVSITQTVNLTNTHYISFEVLMQGEESEIAIQMSIDGIVQNGSIVISNETKTTNKIVFGSKKGENNVTLQIIIHNAKNGTKILLDNISIKRYEYTVFTVILNEYWEYHGTEKVRGSPKNAIINASRYFEKQYGIKIIPLIELKWTVTSTKMSEVYEEGLVSAGKKLKLRDKWDATIGRSTKNNGFDMLLCFSNKTGEHFGFVKRLGENAAFHFAQSNELGNYNWLTIINEWSDNLVQHEVSHIFGALDRARPPYPPSIMSKATTPEQVAQDFVRNELWLQVNNWLYEDQILMIEYIVAFL